MIATREQIEEHLSKLYDLYIAVLKDGHKESEWMLVQEIYKIRSVLESNKNDA